MGFFEKITSYDLLTSLIPGAFLLEAFRASGIPFVDASDLAAWILLAYALGIFCNRVGSLFVEPQIQKRIARNHSYAEYVKATKSDERLESLVEKATFYRTMLTGSGVYLMGMLIFAVFGEFLVDPTWAIPLAALTAMLVFYLSYSKQEKYIAKRVESEER